MIQINCDIGERGPEHPVDIALMDYIHIANIAAGGHAGDEASIATFTQLAKKKGVEITAHLSYPDRENFGRYSMTIARSDLLRSLDTQLNRLTDVAAVKFHGALYNDAVVDEGLARDLADWLHQTGLQRVVTPSDSQLAVFSIEKGLEVLYEAFAERNYLFTPTLNRLTLVSRQLDFASIKDCEQAVMHSREIINKGQVKAFVETAKGNYKRESIPLKVDTICIHSDSEIALELATRLSEMVRTAKRE